MVVKVQSMVVGSIPTPLSQEMKLVLIKAEPSTI